MRALLILALAVIPAVFAVDGGDVAGPCNSFSCAVSNGWEFMITRSYHNYGAPDSSAAQNIANAKAAGIQYTDIYHFPCAMRDAAGQVQSDINSVGQGNFGTMWFDIETNPDSSCAWSSSTTDNCNFLGQLISAGQSAGIRMGVYASPYMWSSIMGGCTVGADNQLPLWYAHYDGSKSFGDYSSFGGWSSPAMKQYWDSVGICGINADADWYP
jgi:GH25 family lysozyme M1 (1,4-beta-N-acetylmuramidase)